MARLPEITDLIGPFAVGALSAASSVVERNAKTDGSDNDMLKGAGFIGDMLIGAYTVANVSGYLGGGGFPNPIRNPVAAQMTAGAGVGLVTKRIAEYLGGVVLELPGWPGKDGVPNLKGAASPTRMLRGGFRRPSAAVETAVQPRKRQFFSVV
jgi:hypothetical protein